MKTLYLDIVGGIAGDMTVAALIDLGVPLEFLREGLAALGMEGIAIDTVREARHSIAGTRFRVTESRDAVPQSVPAGGHSHPHRPYREVRAIVEGAALAEGAKAKALRVFEKLAEAEGAVHGVPPEEVEFHEVGAWDSIADVVCASLALDYLQPAVVYCSRVPLGAGTVRTAHGIMPVPGPATLNLLRGFPVETGGPAFERTTPTGAAILAALARPAPEPFRFTPERVGVGLGTADRPEVANLLRAVLGEAEAEAEADVDSGEGRAEIIECAEANLDDANPEWIGYLMERLLAAGALDVALIPIHMKKNRPGTLLQALYPPDMRGTVEALLFAESTTLGIRYHRLERTALVRETVTVETRWGAVTGKAARHAGRLRFAPEFEDCRRIAERESVPLQEVYREAEAAFSREQRST
ncbi:MAG: nickel pincer cofactor biosynthesis protein LarC [SAR324 cluster bacterium]|nr:nickel pincer cofactor biosynthesis protein LarC [SAR324 cluster bacterium]